MVTKSESELSDEKQAALQELRDLMARTLAIMNGMEDMEHRVGVIIEGGRQQLGHLVAALKIPQMRAELRDISAAMKGIEERLK